MDRFVQVVEFETDKEPVELPAEEDGTLSLSTLVAQFPGACGLKYRNEKTGNWRGVRLMDDRLHAPDSDWTEERIYVIVYPKGHMAAEQSGTDMAVSEKRKGDYDVMEASTHAKQKRSAGQATATADLIILNLPWTVNDADLRTYFSQFGDVILSQVKVDSNSKSRGFGFIRMADFETQIKVLCQTHSIKGRECEAKLPHIHGTSKKSQQIKSDRRIFVGRCSEDLASDDLREHFTQYGEVVDVYIPKPHRGFAFVTFFGDDAPRQLVGTDHLIKGNSVHIAPANPRQNNPPARSEPNHPEQPNNQMMNSQNPNQMGYPMGLPMSMPMNPAMMAMAQMMLAPGAQNMPNPQMSNQQPAPQNNNRSSGYQAPGNNQASGNSRASGDNQASGNNQNQASGNNQNQASGGNNQNQASGGNNQAPGWGSQQTRNRDDSQKDVKGSAAWEAARETDQSMDGNDWN